MAQTPTIAAQMERAVRDGRFVHPLTVGGLRVVPDPQTSTPDPLGLSLSEATEDAHLSQGPNAPPTLVGFGLVSVTGVGLPTGIPTLTNTPAWVGVVPPSSSVVFCGALTTTTTTPSSIDAHHGIYTAVVLFGAVASGGNGALVYHSAGDRPCDEAPAGPATASATALVPVSWVQAGPAGTTVTIRFQAPVCAPAAEVTGGATRTGINTLQVLVRVPFDRTGCGAVRTFTETEPLYPPKGPGTPPRPAVVTVRGASIPSGIPPALLGALAR